MALDSLNPLAQDIRQRFMQPLVNRLKGVQRRRLLLRRGHNSTQQEKINDQKAAAGDATEWDFSHAIEAEMTRT